MKIVVLDGYTLNPGDLSWDKLGSLGELAVYDRTPRDLETIIERIKDADAIFTNKVPIDGEVLKSCHKLKYIGVLATGYNVVDTVAAAEKGLTVCNVPTYGTEAVGQFTIGLLLEICHHIGHHNDAVHQGRWSSAPDWCFWDYPLMELSGKTMGIIGFGRIGQSVGRIAQALGMKVQAYDSYPNPKLVSNTCYYSDMNTLLKTSDVISLHCPLLPETNGIICSENIEKMKPGVIILNSSRGALINERDLANALKCGKVYAAGLDVVSVEPIKEDNPLLQAPNCLITPHIAWAPRESRKRLMDIAVENLVQFLSDKPVNLV